MVLVPGSPDSGSGRQAGVQRELVERESLPPSSEIGVGPWRGGDVVTPARTDRAVCQGGGGPGRVFQSALVVVVGKVPGEV